MKLHAVQGDESLLYRSSLKKQINDLLDTQVVVVTEANTTNSSKYNKVSLTVLCGIGKKFNIYFSTKYRSSKISFSHFCDFNIDRLIGLKGNLSSFFTHFSKYCPPSTIFMVKYLNLTVSVILVQYFGYSVLEKSLIKFSAKQRKFTKNTEIFKLCKNLLCAILRKFRPLTIDFNSYLLENVI